MPTPVAPNNRTGLRERSATCSICAILGAEAGAIIQTLKVFQGREYNDWFIARTGYTGEEGLEILVPEAEVVAFWQKLLTAGVLP